MLKKIYVLLTKFPDSGSRMLSAVTRCFYTHASIGLEEDPNTFYSFALKGFIIEKLTRYLRPDRAPFPCRLYELAVSETEYAQIKEKLHDFVACQSKLAYTRLGVFLGLMHIPYKRKSRYFCSQFVAEVLKNGKIVTLDKDSALCFPRDLQFLPEAKLRFEGNLQSMLQHFGVLPCPAR